MGYLSFDAERELSIEHGFKLEQAQLDFVSAMAKIPAINYQLRSLLTSILTGAIKDVKRNILAFTFAGETTFLNMAQFSSESTEVRNLFFCCLQEIVEQDDVDFCENIKLIRFTSKIFSQFHTTLQTLNTVSNSLGLRTVSDFDQPEYAMLEKEIESLGLPLHVIKTVAKEANDAFTRMNIEIQAFYQIGSRMLDVWQKRTSGSKYTDELRSAAREGITYAAYKYDPRSGVPFRSMAEQWVRFYCKKTINELDNTVYFTDAAEKQLTKFKKWRNHLSHSGENHPTFLMLAEKMGKTVDEIHEIAILATSSETVDITENDYFHNTIEDESVENIATDQIKQLIANTSSQLSERNQFVLTARQSLGYTLEQVGLELGVCKERARQIEKEAYLEFKEALAAKGFHSMEDFL